MAEFLLPHLDLCSLMRLIDIDRPRGSPPVRHRGHWSNDHVGVVLRDGTTRRDGPIAARLRDPRGVSLVFPKLSLTIV